MAEKNAISRYLAEIGSKGGKVKGVAKGFASLSDEQRKAVAKKAAAGRRAAASKRKKATK